MIALFLILFAIMLDTVVACVVGTVFFTMWHWLIIPMFEPAFTLTWAGAVIVVFALSFLTKNSIVSSPFSDIDDLEDLFKSFYKHILCVGSDCLIQLSLIFVLWIVLI